MMSYINIYLPVIFFMIIVLFYLGLDFLSPELNWVTINLVTTFIGVLFFDLDVEGVSVEIKDSAELYLDIYKNSCIFILAFLIGAVATNIFMPRRDEVILNFSEKINPRVYIYFWYFSMIMYVIGTGFLSLFYRVGYEAEFIKVFKTMGSVLFLLSNFVIGYTARKYKNFFKSSLLLLTFGMLVYASYSSRMLAMAFIFFAQGLYVCRRDLISKSFAIISFLSVPFLIQIPLYMRGSREQGFFPLVYNLISGAIFEEFSIMVVVNNLFAGSFKITALTAIYANISNGYIGTSVSPMPGFMTDWMDLEHDLNPSTPYNVFGEWMAYGVYFGVIFYILLGSIYAYIGIRARLGDILYSTIGVGFLLLCSVSMLQYNTRTSMRIIYYLIFLMSVKFIYDKVKFKSHK